MPLDLIRQNYLENAAETKIKFAPNHQKRPSTELFIGDCVRYYRETTKTNEARRGPAKIVGKDGETFIVKHGGLTVSCHNRDVRKIRRDKNFQSTESEKIEKKLMRNKAENYGEFNGTKIFIKTKPENAKHENKNEKGACSCHIKDTAIPNLAMPQTHSSFRCVLKTF